MLALLSAGDAIEPTIRHGEAQQQVLSALLATRLLTTHPLVEPKAIAMLEARLASVNPVASNLIQHLPTP